MKRIQRGVSLFFAGGILLIILGILLLLVSKEWLISLLAIISGLVILYFWQSIKKELAKIQYPTDKKPF